MKKNKLFCIPYAGGSSTVYYKWSPYMDERVEMIAIELAGRGSRMDEPFYKDWNCVIDDVYHNIVNNIGDSDYAIMGHSMGCWIAFDVLERIISNCLKLPQVMFFSGNSAPHLELKEEKISHLPDELFINKILELGDTPKELFEDEYLSSIFLPILKSDYSLVESYENKQRNVSFENTICVLTGENDVFSVEDMREWDKYSSGKFEIKIFPYGHMFISEDAKNVVEYICNKINEVIK